MREKQRLITGIIAPIALLFAALTSNAAQSQPDTSRLPIDKTVERQINNDEVHIYVAGLKAGNVLRVELQEKGADIKAGLLGMLKITDPHVVAITNFGSGYDRERLTAVIEQDGNYAVMVGKRQSPLGGRYQLRASIREAATATDREEIRAERLLMEGIASRGKGTLGDLQTAIDKLEEALPLWKKLGEKYWEGYTRTFLGFIYGDLGENQQALELLDQALQLRRLAGDKGGEAYTLSNMGIIYADMGEKQQALELLNQALLISRLSGNKSAEAFALTGLGRVYDDLGDKQKAMESYNQALPRIKAIGDTPVEVATLNNIGVAYSVLGEYQRGLKFFDQALQLSRIIGHKQFEARAFNNVCLTYFGLGEEQKTLNCLDQARTLFRVIGDKSGEASVLTNIGWFYAGLGEKQKALDLLGQALPLSRSTGDKSSEAFILYGIGMVHKDSVAEPAALEYLDQALTISRQIESPELERNALASTGLIYRNLGRLDEARANIESALRIAESLRTRVPTKELRASYTSSIHEIYQYYVDLLMRLHQQHPAAGFDAAALQASERGRARSLLELLIESHADIKRGVEPALLAQGRAISQLLDAKAERLTRILSSTHTEAQAAAAKKEVDDLIEQHQQVEAQIRQKSPRYAALTQPQPLTLAEIQKLLDADTLLLEYSLGPERSYLWAVTQSSYKTYELPKASEIEEAATKFYQSLQSAGPVRKSGRRKTRAERVYTASAAGQAQGLARKLSQMLLSPAASMLGQKRLVIVPDGALQYLPFAALADPSNKTKWEPLILRHEIVSLPSASALAIQRRELEGRKPAPKTAIVIADPVFSADDSRVKRGEAELAGATQNSVEQDEPLYRLALKRAIGNARARTPRGGLPRLPGTRREGEAVVALVGENQSKLIMGFAARREAAESDEMSQYRYVHFATHGLLDSQNPELSALVLSLVDEQGQQQDGYLRTHQIFNLDLPAEVVVLSACQTGLGKDVRGEGLVGLTRGFMYAGAKRVVVSLWSVNDDSTAELMTRFYAGMLKEGKRPAEALRAAQIEMFTKRKRWRAPYYWAPFVLQGEWR